VGGGFSAVQGMSCSQMLSLSPTEDKTHEAGKDECKFNAVLLLNY
jgi:hypothetical protein